MAIFRCNACKQIYEDNYPPDDCCLKCKVRFIKIIAVLQMHEQSMWISTL